MFISGSLGCPVISHICAVCNRFVFFHDLCCAKGGRKDLPIPARIEPPISIFAHREGDRPHYAGAVDTLLRPAALALYKASSAALITAVRSSSGCGSRLTVPMLAVTQPYSLPACSI